MVLRSERSFIVTALALKMDLLRFQAGSKKVNFSTVFAGKAVWIEEVQDAIWLVSFTVYDLGYFDLETRMLEPLENPFGPKV